MNNEEAHRLAQQLANDELPRLTRMLAFHATNADEPRVSGAAGAVLEWLDTLGPLDGETDDAEPLPPDEDLRLLWDTVKALHDEFTEYKRDTDNAIASLRVKVAGIDYLTGHLDKEHQRRGLRARLRGLWR